MMREDWTAQLDRDPLYFQTELLIRKASIERWMLDCLAAIDKQIIELQQSDQPPVVRQVRIEVLNLRIGRFEAAFHHVAHSHFPFSLN